MKKRSKQLIALLLSVSLCTSFVGCGDSKKKTNNSMSGNGTFDLFGNGTAKESVNSEPLVSASEDDLFYADSEDEYYDEEDDFEALEASYMDTAKDIYDQLEETLVAVKTGDVATIMKHTDPYGDYYDELEDLLENDPNGEILQVLLQNYAWTYERDYEDIAFELANNEGYLDDYRLDIGIAEPYLLYADHIYAATKPEGYVFPDYYYDYTKEEQKALVNEVAAMCPLIFEDSVYLDYKEGILYVELDVFDRLDSVEFDDLCECTPEKVYREFIYENLDFEDYYIEKDATFEFVNDLQHDMWDSIEANDIDTLYKLYDEHRNPNYSFEVEKDLLDVSGFTDSQMEAYEDAVNQINIYRANVAMSYIGESRNIGIIVFTIPYYYTDSVSENCMDFVKEHHVVSIEAIYSSDNEYPLAAYQYLREYTRMTEYISKYCE